MPFGTVFFIFNSKNPGHRVCPNISEVGIYLGIIDTNMIFARVLMICGELNAYLRQENGK